MTVKVCCYAPKPVPQGAFPHLPPPPLATSLPTVIVKRQKRSYLSLDSKRKEHCFDSILLVTSNNLGNASTI